MIMIADILKYFTTTFGTPIASTMKRTMPMTAIATMNAFVVLLISPHDQAVGAVCDRPQCRNRDIEGGHRRCKRIGIERIPLLASPQGGVAEQSIKCREASADSETGVVFRMRTKRKTTPAASASLEAARYRACASRVASRYFLDDAATPPCGDARRGITRADRNSFTRSQSR